MQVERDNTGHALDELFQLARKYKSSPSYWALVQFIARFRRYSPFNAMLIHVQMPGAHYVAPASRWRRDFRRRIRPDGHPLVILQPMGPVMFVFDVSDTEAEETAPSLPREIESPFEVYRGQIGKELDWAIENAKRDGIRISEQVAGSQSAGAILTARSGMNLHVLIGHYPEERYSEIPLRYDIVLNSKHSSEAKYATLVHELAHLYCGHLGTPNERWWPDRTSLAHGEREFEAESVCYLVCTRLGIDNPSAEYLSSYLTQNDQVPQISLESVMKASGLIERMASGRLKPRKADE